MTSNSSRVCIGTWKLFEKNNLQEGTNVIKYALESGFNSFDTAHVYSNSSPEKLLGTLDSKIWVANKLSAKSGCIDDLSIEDAYPEEYVFSFLSKMILNGSLDVLQIHNWLPGWGEKEYSYLSDVIKSTPEFGSISIGVSLSSDTQYSLDSIRPFEYVQLPLNINDYSNLYLIDVYGDSKKFLARNVFDGGNLDFRTGLVSKNDSIDAFNFVFCNKYIYKIIVGCNSIDSVDLVSQYVASIKTESGDCM